MNVQNQTAMQKFISSTVIQDPYNGKIITTLKSCSRHITHYFKKDLHRSKKKKKKLVANWERPIINRYSIYLISTHAMFKECKPKMHHYVE